MANPIIIPSDANLQTSDITTNDVSTSKHGFCPKGTNTGTKFLRDDATWATPAGGGGGKIIGIWTGGDTDYFETSFAPLNLATGTNVSKLKHNVMGDTTEVFNNLLVYIPDDVSASETIYIDHWVEPETHAANDVIMRMNINTAFGNGESWDTAYTSHVSSATTMSATAKIVSLVSISDTATNLGLVAGKWNHMKSSRAVDLGGDTLSGNLRIIGIVIRRA